MSETDHAGASRPWWASTDPEVDRLDPDEDPLDAITAARRRAGPAPEGDAGASGPDEDDEHVEGSEMCGVCPLCTGWRYVRENHPDAASHLAAAGRHLSEAHPEVASHLAAAARHLTAALRQVLDDREAGVETDGGAQDPASRGAGGRSRPAARDGFERIDLDDGQGQV